MSNRHETWLGLPERRIPLIRAGVALGLGLGGFFDGIVFHQILQVHHMLTSHPNPSIAGDLELNTLADGMFHATTYLLTIAGIGLLWRARGTLAKPRSGRTLLGSITLGWGVFNVVEGLVNHQLLGIHHVWPAGPGPVILWDALFLAWGVLFVGVGYRLAQSG